MAFEESIIINAKLAGTREYLANAQAVAGSNVEIADSADAMGRSFDRTTRRSYLMNQALFTVRRMLYGVTLATIGGAAEAFKWGWQFNSAMQQARVALLPLQGAAFNVNKELDYLFNFTKYTPFQFKDMTIAFRNLYGAMHTTLGTSAHDVNRYLKAVVDALAFSGKTSPGALNRVAIALQHVAFQGRLTGQAVTQLARDGLPVWGALTKYLGITKDQLHAISSMNIPPSAALNAIFRFIENTKGYQDAAKRQALYTFHGQFTTFKDNMGQIMGAVEKGWFHHLQGLLTRTNNFFNGLAHVMKNGGNFTDIVRVAGGGHAVMFWQQVTADLRLFWRAFSGLIVDVFKSKMVWVTLYAALVLLHGVLIPVVWFIQHFGSLLYILIPLLITYRLQIMYLTLVEKSAVFWTAVMSGETKKLTFVMWLARLATRGYAAATAWLAIENKILWLAGLRVSIMVFLLSARMRVAMVATRLYSIAVGLASLVLGDGMVAALAGATAGVWAFTVALLANPITWLVLAVVALTAGLVILYFKWKWFHNEVNGLWKDLISWSPLVAVALGAAFGPIGLAVTGLALIVRYWGQIKKFGGDVIHPFGKPQGKAGWSAKDLLTGNTPVDAWLKHPHFALGGTMPWSGSAWVGENGPELLSLPRGAQVTPMSKLQPLFNLKEAWMQGDKQPVIIRLQLGHRVLEEVSTEIQSGRMARA